MSMLDFLAGAALFAVMLTAVGVATGLVLWRRLMHLDRLELALAGVVTGTAILIGVHLLPLMLGILTRGTVLLACALAVGAALVVPPVAAPVDGAADEEVLPDADADGVGRKTRPPVPPSGRAAWVLAGVATAFASVAAVADLARWAGDEIIGVDPLTFHLPNVARWIQHQSLWQIDQFTPLLAHGNYPNNGDVVLLSALLPWHNDFLVRLPITFFLVTTAVAVFAVARELRAPHAASLLAAAAAISLPVVGIATIPRALPDSLMWTAFACGTLFLLRHARTARLSDLVLAGVALGIASGTKWYGVSSVAVVVVLWIAARLAVARRATRAAAAAGATDERGGAGTQTAAPAGAGRRALHDIVLVGGFALLGTLVWLVRNLALSDNPVFPLKVAPFGITIFDAPPDVIRDQVGFTIADYAGDPDVLRQLAGEIVEGLGYAAVICGVAIVVAALLARRGGRAPDRRVLVVALGAVTLGLLYAVTPATALGLRGDPSLASANTRYAVPALLLAIPLAAWLAGRLPRMPALALQAALAVSALLGAYKGYEVHGARDVVLAAAGLAALAAAAYALWRLRARRLVLVVAALGAALIGLAGAHRIEGAINDGRYVGIDPAVDTLLRIAPSGKHIGLASDWSVAGLSPIWPAFGTRIGNDVEFLGEFVDGFLTPYPTEATFQEALLHGGFDVLVVGRGFYPPQDTREQRWAADAGWRTVALSTRLRVLVPPLPPRTPSAARVP